MLSGAAVGYKPRMTSRSRVPSTSPAPSRCIVEESQRKGNEIRSTAEHRSILLQLLTGIRLLPADRAKEKAALPGGKTA